ncbi:MAG: UDP-N-acetylmuramate dehydrogenase [Proteobacteria bacterium]|nr:UDP-N-acetylmuramate dehydrogenase [Pseudomonadota bacterium]
MVFDDKLKSELEKKFGNFVRFDVPMSSCTSLSIGGPADALAEPDTIDDLALCLKWVNEKKLPATVIGSGTNLLVRDNGIRGVVITLKKMNSDMLVAHETREHVFFTAGAGRSLHSVVRYAIDKGFSGLSFAIGIPGTVGGSIIMNAGTGKGTMGDVIDAVHILSPDGNIKILSRESLNFSYRHFDIRNKNGSTTRHAILIDAMFKLEKGDSDTLQKEADMIMSARKRTQPMNLKSAGCFFKNPDSGKSAGELIDIAGLKGKKIGGAEVSTIHANYFINAANATASDMLELRDLVRQKVADTFGIYLEEEVRIIGE